MDLMVGEKDNEHLEETTVNSMVPIWKKDKKDVKDEDYDNFYTDRFYDYEKPIKVIKSKVEGLCSYDALLFIPSHAPMDYYTKDFEKGLELYSKGVLITDKCSELLPDYFSFVKGIVDSEDIDLNISRETMQQNHQVKNIARSIESKIKKELMELQKEDREGYEKFFEAFGSQIKYGIYSSFGSNKELLQDLLLFYSSKDDKLTTLAEYHSRLPEDERKIYYASGESIAKIKNMPQVENMIEAGHEVLFLTDYLDEFTLKAMTRFEGHDFVNVLDEKTDDIETDEVKKINDDNKDLLKVMKEALDISNIKFSDKLKNHPVALASEGEVSIEMEKAFKAMPNGDVIKANKILEINTNHEVYHKLIELYENKKEDEVKNYTKVLYNMARLINGLNVDDANELTNIVCELISK